MIQSRQVAAGLRREFPEVSVEVVGMRTTGDRHQDVPLGPSLGQSFFTKEIEHALLRGEIDVAVHSCKDLATSLPDGLVLAAIAEREDPRDALVSLTGVLSELPEGARVGTSSPRRKGFLAQARPDLRILDHRGGVPTRIAALDEGRYDAIVLAVAGLKRLELDHRITEIFDIDTVLPAAGQGALAVQARTNDVSTLERLQRLDDVPAHTEVRAERSCLRRLGAGCHAPVGAFAEIGADDRVTLRAAIPHADGLVHAEATAPAPEAEALGVAVASELLATLGVSSLPPEGASDWASWITGASR